MLDMILTDPNHDTFILKISSFLFVNADTQYSPFRVKNVLNYHITYCIYILYIFNMRKNISRTF